MSLEDYDYALKFRDVITELIAQQVDLHRPPSRYAVVYSIDKANSKCSVRYTGDDTDTVVSMGSIQPTTPGQIVRISGTSGDRYVDDVMNQTATLGTTTPPPTSGTGGVGTNPGTTTPPLNPVPPAPPNLLKRASTAVPLTNDVSTFTLGGAQGTLALDIASNPKAVVLTITTNGFWYVYPTSVEYDGAPVVALGTYTGVVTVNSQAAGNVRAQLSWYNSSGVYLSNAAGATVSVSPNVPQQLFVTAVAPANAAFALVQPTAAGSFTNGTTAVTVRVYKFGIMDGESQEWTSPPVTSGGTLAPTAPTLTATATSPNSVALSWTESTDDTGISSYQIRRGTTTSNMTVLVDRVTERTYTDTTVTADTSYVYTVSALDTDTPGARRSVPSLAVTVKTGVSLNGLPIGGLPLGPGNAYGIRVAEYDGPLATKALQADGTLGAEGDIANSADIINQIATMAGLSNNGSVALNVYQYTSNQYVSKPEFPKVTVAWFDHRGNQRFADFPNVPIEDGLIGITRNNEPSVGTDRAVAFWDKVTNGFWSFWKMRTKTFRMNAATVGPIDLVNFPAIVDGVILNPQKPCYVLVKNQTVASENGFYTYLGNGKAVRTRPNGIDHENVASFHINVAQPQQRVDNNIDPGGNGIVLLLRQNDSSENGYWRWPTSYTSVNGVTVGATAATRITGSFNDYDYQGCQMKGTQGMPIPVDGGSQAGQVWAMTSTNSVTVGTTAITFAQQVGADPNKAYWMASMPGYEPNLATNTTGRFPNNGGNSASGCINETACINLAEAKEAKRRALAGESLRGAIPHALAVGWPRAAYWRLFGWPAQRSDGPSLQTGEPPYRNLVLYGQRARLRRNFNPDTDMPGAHYLSKAFAWAAHDYGLMFMEKAGTVTVMAERGTVTKDEAVDPWINILTDIGDSVPTPSFRVFEGMPPWTPANWEALPRHYGRPGSWGDPATLPASPEKTLKSYVVLDRPIEGIPYSFPARVRPYEPARTKLILRNLGTLAIQVANGSSSNASANAPGGGAFLTTVQPGQEVDMSDSTASVFVRSATSGTVTGYRVAVYTEMGIV